jgi:hypothetical protein
MSRAKVNTMSKYRDKYEGMGYQVVNLEEPKQAEKPAAVDNPVWVIAFEIFFGLAMIGVVAVTWIKLLAPLFMEMLP